MSEPSYNSKPLGDWLRFLADRRKHVRQFALDNLQEIGAEGAAAVPALSDVVRGPFAELREPAATLLARIGKAAVPSLLVALQAAEEGVRRAAAMALALIGPAAKESLPAIRKAAGDPSAEVRVKAGEALWAVGHDAATAVPVLIRVLKETTAVKDWSVREQAKAALVQIGEPAKTAIKPLLNDGVETVRQAAIDTLGQIDPDDPDYQKHAPADDDEDAEPTAPAGDGKPEGPVNWSWIVPLVALTVLAPFQASKLFELLMLYWGVFIYETLYYGVMAAAAWRRGFRVDRVSVGFGPQLLRWRYRDAECSVHLIPITGEVNWFAVVPADPDDPYERLSLWYNVAFETLGMVSQFAVGVLILAGSWWIGRADPAYITGPAQVGWVRSGSALEAAALKPGDIVQTVTLNGQTTPVYNWRELAWALIGVTGPVTLQVQRGEQSLPIEVYLDRYALLDIDHEMPAKVVAVVAKTPAARVGIRPGDEIIAVDGQSPRHWLEVKHAIFPPDGSTPTSHTLKLRRKDETVEVKLLAVELDKGSLGVRWKAERGPVVSMSLWGGLTEAVREAGEIYKNVFLWLTRQGEHASEYDRAAEETDIRRPLFIAPEGFSSRVPVMLGLVGIMLTLYYLVALSGLMVLATVERIRKRSMPEWVTTSLEWTTSCVVVALVAYRAFG